VLVFLNSFDLPFEPVDIFHVVVEIVLGEVVVLVEMAQGV